MRPIGTLDCADCNGRHDVHVTRAGELLTLNACPASGRDVLPDLARRRVEGELDRARRQLDAVERLFASDRINTADVNSRLDEVHRHLVHAQNALSDPAG